MLDGHQVDLSGGPNVVTVTVTVAGTAKDYTLTVIRASVPHGWSLRPPDLVTGSAFRLLIVTSTTRNARSGDIADYDAHVQSALADLGHADIRGYSPLFKALAATKNGTTPKGHTDTNPGSDGPGEQIWWLNGPRAANNYADFYDGSWDHSNPARTEAGRAKTFEAYDVADSYNAVWTGTTANGNRSNNRHLGTTEARRARFGVPFDRTTVWNARGYTFKPRELGMYGLSEVLLVEAPDSPYATVAAITTDPANGDDYRAGETIKATVTFSEAVTVIGTPQLPLRIGSDVRNADYAAADSTDTVLSFSYIVRAGDIDWDGISIDAFALNKLSGGSITRKDASVDAALTHTRVVANDHQRVNLWPYIVDDGVAVTSSPQAGTDTYGAGEDIEITVTFSEAVTVTGHVDFGFSVSGPVQARLVSGNGTTELVFAYTVRSGDDDDNGIFIGNHNSDNPTFALQTWESIVSPETGLDAVLEHDEVGREDDHKVNGSLTGADARLSDLSLSGIYLGRPFFPWLTAYTAEVANSVSATTVTAMASQIEAGVVITPADADTGTMDHQVALVAGENTITVTVTATNGTSTRTYTVTVNRPSGPGADADLRDLTIDGTSVSGFTAGATAYTLDVPFSRSQVIVAATAFDGRANVSITPADADTGVDGHQVDLGVGDNTVRFTVTARDGTKTKTYTLTINRAEAGLTAEFGAAEYAAPEGLGAVTVTVNLSSHAHTTVTIPVTVTARGGAESGDYSLSATEVTFNIDDTSAAFTVTATDDTDLDPGESLTLSFGTLPDGVTEGSQATATVALTDNEVPVTSSLLPDGAAIGDELRLLFVTSTKRNATSSDIAVYNGFVQRAAAADGHADIRSYGGQFRALASTNDVIARDNTGTTHTSSDRGVPIYWLNGPKAADHYEDFYDGSWDHRDPGRDEDGADVDFDRSPDKLVWTGTRSDGTASPAPLGGGTLAVYADPDQGVGKELLYGVADATRSYRIYGLSFVLHVVPPASTPYVTGVEAVSPPASGSYRTGDTITLAVTFSEEVSVSGMPTFPLSIGSDTRQAQYQSADSTPTRLVFSHDVTDDDYDNGGISNAEVELALPTGTTITRKNDATVAAYPGRIVWDPDLKVNPSMEVRSFAGNGRIDVEWVAPASGADGGYRVQWKAPAETEYDMTRSAEVADGDTEYAITSLTNGDTYVVQVQALDPDSAVPAEAAESSEVTVGRPQAVRNLTAAGRRNDFRVSWDAPDERGVGFLQDADGNPVLVYRISWEKQGQSSDLAQHQAICSAAGTAKNGWFEITSVPPGGGIPEVVLPQDGDIYSFTFEFRFQTGSEVVTMGCSTQSGFGEGVEASGTAGRATASAEDHAAVHAALAAVVDARDDEWPWLRTAWGHIAGMTVQADDLDRGVEGQTGARCSTTTNSSDDLGGCTFFDMTIDMDWDLLTKETFDYVAVHELAHAWTLVNDLHDQNTRGPVGRALLYFFGQEYKGDAAMMAGCTVETLADALSHVAEEVNPGVLAYYGDRCFSDGRTEPKALSEGVALHAMHPSGADPDGSDTTSSWFTDTYTGASASADAWAAVSEIGSARYRYLVMNMLQDEFGGLCSIRVANIAVYDDDSDVTDPWNDGGCEPDAPAVTAAPGAGAGSIEVSWTAPANGGAPRKGYEVHWKPSADTWPSDGTSFVPAREAELDDPAATSYTISGLTAGAAYTVRVRASNSIGDGEWSTDTSVTSGAPARSDLPPPKNVRAVEEQGAVKLNWDAPDDATVTGYRIERRLADEDRRDNHTLVEDTGSSETGYTDQSAEKGVEYDYRVSARNEDGAGEASGWVSAAPDEEPVASEDVVAWSAIMTVEWVYQGYGYYSTDTKKAGSLSPASFEVDGTTYTVKMVETQGWWMYIGVDRELPFDFVLELDGTRFASNDASFSPYSYGNIYRWEGTGLSLSDGDAVEVRLLRAFEDETAVNSAATGAPVISGTAQVGETVTADTSGIADEDGLDNVTFTYQWLADDTEVAGATGSIYTLVEADEGKAIKVQVSFTDDGGNEETLTSTAMATVEAPPNNPATGAPIISGTVQVGETLTADTSGIADADGLDNAAFSYQWLADDSDISGATGSTYTLVEADEGKAIKAQVSFTDDAGHEETLTNAATDAVAAATQPNNPATGAPTISGTAQVGETLTADTSGIADADGLTSVTYSYQWLAGDSDISGATGSTYTLGEADEGKTVRVEVSFTDDAGNEETLTSTATEAVAGNEEPVAREDVAAWSATMTVEWVYQGYGYYSTDTKKAGSLTPASFEVDGTTYTVKMVETQGWWTYIGTDRELPFDFVLELDETRFASSDASFSSYSYGNIYRWEGTGLSLSDGDTVEVRLLRAFEDETAVNSAATGAPVISGTVQVGETLAADTLAIADADGLDNADFSYQWLADDTEIAGATGSTHTLTDADEGKAIKVQVSFTDDAGNGETLTSAATDAVTAALAANGPATGAPTISGTVQVGETLTADTSGIEDADGLDNAAFTYQWLADDADIAGATGSTYTLVEADEGKAIKVQVSFTDDGGNDETLTSAATDAVTAAPTPNTPATGAPTISGTAQVGETLTADTSGISDTDGLTTATLSYQWLADAAEIAGATGSAYTLVEADEGKTVKVRVSFTDDGGNGETLTSAATDTVTAAEPSGPPARPTGLTAEVSHDSVTLTWDDPNDDTITGYVILRRDKDIHEEGTFETVESDTGSAGTTYTDDTVEAEKQYVYRIKAINADGLSEISSWVRAHTPAAPAPEPTQEPTPEPESVSEGDTDLPNDNSTPGRVAVGGSATGAIGTAVDQDRFAVELVAGRTYQFDLTGSPGGGGTLPDTFFRAIYNSAGQYQADSYNDDFDGGRDSRVTFTATESGTYYARVSGDRDEVGSYTLSVTDVTPQ